MKAAYKRERKQICEEFDIKQKQLEQERHRKKLGDSETFVQRLEKMKI